ncbi:MAG: histidine phosphatase family protein, partial [Proteobacteria bacterium]|nr:histidine phosphatase family protein [Pseudomonadota bacterium]
MALYLVQHGQSLPKDVDPDQGLSEKGVTETGLIAEVAKNYQIKVGQIMHSVKTRARKTADIFASALNPTGGVKEVEGLKPMDDVATFAAVINPDTHT